MKVGPWLARALAALVLGGLVMLTGAVTASGGNSAPARQQGMLTAPAKGKPLAIALHYLRGHAAAYGLAAGDLRGVDVTDQYRDAHNGVTHIYLRQRYRGIEVYNGNITISITRDGSVLSVGNRFVPRLAAAAGGATAARTAIDAVRSAARHLDIDGGKALKVLDRTGGAANEVLISRGGISTRAIPAKLVWQPLANGRVRLAWDVQIAEAGAEHSWSVRVDAATGAVLDTADFVAHDTASAIASAIARPAAAKGAAAPRSAALKSPNPVDDGSSYEVFELPKESPTEGGRTVVTNPADADASPFGWHDTDGDIAPDFTVTRGNNVHAYADRSNDNLPDPGSDPDGGAGLDFSFPLDLTHRPLDSQPAYVTNLFYWNNLMHDISYGYGFTEAAGNFQVDNYGKGGPTALGTDHVNAEAQDGSGRNNANFNTEVDGVPGRMQMYEWRSALPNPIVIHPPSAIAGTYFGPMAGFGESLVTTGPISGEAVYIGRGCDPVYQPTTPPTPPIPLDPYLANPSGKIAIIDRGVCTFVAKVKKAQDLGALFVIVVQNNTQPPIAMGGSDPTITIPSVMVNQVDGELMKANDPFNMTVSDGTGGVPDRDSDIDNGVIAHEYGHGISNRLTGGPSTVSCLQNAEQMGEGWSDWWALTLTTEPGDTATTARGVGTYVSFQPENGPGIRPAQYTTDMTVNPWTYAGVADTVNISQPHGIGFIWNSMLWEVYWKLVAKHGYNVDVYDEWHTGGNNLALQLVMDGMKNQPCSPGFVDGRNAIVAGDLALTGGANNCEIWNGFAKRGLGVSASQGLSSNRSDGVEAFNVPTACQMTGFFGGVKNDPVLNTQKAGATASVTFSLGGNKGLGIFDAGYPAYRSINCTTKQPTGAETPAAVPEGTSLTYDPVLDRYTYPWKTPKPAPSCAMLILQFSDDSRQVAYFRFT